MPTPTIPGGHGLPPAPTIDSSTNCLIPFTPSAGTHIFRKLMFSEPEPFGTHLTSSPSQSSMKSQWTIGSRWPVFGPVFSRVLEGRALGAGLQRLVDSRRVQGKVLADTARVDSDARVLADEVLVVVRDLDVAHDGVEHAPTGHRGLALLGVDEGVAQVLRDVFQRPDVEVRRGVLDRLAEVDGDGAHAACSAALWPARRPKTVHSSRLLPIIRLRPCVPPAISPQAKRPGSVVSPCLSITRPPFW